MPVSSQTAHRTLTNPCLPYVTFSSPTSVDPQFFSGQNVMTSVQQILEKYPGFGAGIETTPQVAGNTVSRLFAWKKWDTATTTGSYFWMKCETGGGTSKVYKLQVGVDANFILIYTDSTSANPFDFTVGNNTCLMGNNTTRTNMRAFDGLTGATTTRLWGIDSPTVAPTIPSITVVANGINGFVGYVYFYTYYNSSNGHESSPSPISPCTGMFTNSQVNIGVTASTDTQVTNIRVYRSTDGGSQAPEDAAEISGSPFTNTTQTVADTTTDALLSLRFAPAALRNDPPPASNGFAQFANRIWAKSSNKVYFSGFEEIVNGVEEESWPSGGDGNFYPYPSQVNGLAGLDSLIVVATADTLFGIDGDSLDSFRRYTVSARNGVKSSTNISTVSLEPGTVLAAWLDSTGTVWMQGRGEIGLPIRPDLDAINQLQSALTFHISGSRHWLLVMDTANGKLFTFDLDTGMWMPPRIVTANSIFSGETSAGVWDLAIGHTSGKVLKLTPSNYNDNGVTYSSNIVTNLFTIAGSTNPNHRGVTDYVAVEGDTTQPTSVTITTDDDPRSSVFISPSKVVDPDLRTQGTYLTEKYYKFNTPAARRMAYKCQWDAADSNFRVYGLDICYHPVGM